jgi:glycosyltransferase involved in cell wall biosynthesis
VVAVDTFDHPIGALVHLPRIAAIRRRVVKALRDHAADSAVVLMPHVWTPLIASAIKRAGARYTVIIHDAAPHPGDTTALLHRWLLRDVRHADRVITLSEHVARQLVSWGVVPAARVRTLFLPASGAQRETAGARLQGPVAFLFFGRIVRYKGLSLFVDACEMLRNDGQLFQLGVVGEGDISDQQPRLERLGAEVVNRWVAHSEIAAILNRYDAVVVPSTEASQSGVIALAHGHGLPAIVTPVGGLPGQVEHGPTGLVASSVSAAGIAAEMRRFLLEPQLRGQLRAGLSARRQATSMARFVDAIIDAS